MLSFLYTRTVFKILKELGLSSSGELRGASIVITLTL